MKSFSTVSLATTLLTTLVSAQEQYRIDPNSVDNSTRQYWCQQQTSQCPLICLQTAANSATTSSNECDPSSLTYSCVCDNGLSPNLSEYSQTLPTNICQEWGNQCVSNCNGDNSCAAACRDNHPCGAQSPTRQNTSTITSTTTSASASGSGSVDGGAATTDSSGQTIYSGFAGQSASSTGNGDDNNGGSGGDSSGASTLVRVWALSAGQTFGTIGVVGAFVGGFAIFL